MYLLSVNVNPSCGLVRLPVALRESDRDRLYELCSVPHTPRVLLVSITSLPVIAPLLDLTAGPSSFFSFNFLSSISASPAPTRSFVIPHLLFPSFCLLPPICFLVVSLSLSHPSHPSLSSLPHSTLPPGCTLRLWSGGAAAAAAGRMDGKGGGEMRRWGGGRRLWEAFGEHGVAMVTG